MEDEQKGLEAPKNKDAGPPMTGQEFRDALDALFERAKAAGVKPIQEMARAYARKGLEVFDRMMVALEDDTEGKKKK